MAVKRARKTELDAAAVTMMHLSQPCTADSTKNGHPGCYDKGCSCWCHKSFYAGLFQDDETALD